MTNESRRITLVARHPNAPGRNWDESNPKNRLVFIDALSFVGQAVDRRIHELKEDVSRVIIDRTGTTLEYLEALSGLPSEFVGDVLFVMAEGRGFLSSVGRGGDRVLYSLTQDDIDFYLETNGLVLSRGISRSASADSETQPAGQTFPPWQRRSR